MRPHFFVDIKIIDSDFYFNFPDALGIQKLLNGILFSSASVFYFFLAVILFFVCVFIMAKVTALEENIKKKREDEIWRKWVEESNQSQKNSEMKRD